MKISKLTAAVFGDVHTGHSKTPTVSILDNLYRAFPDNEETATLDIIFIEGDFFDKLLSLNDPDVIEIKIWINNFLRMCAKRDIVVRVLEGTPSHDWKQPKLFETINEISKINCDLKYIDTLCIEHIDRFGIDVLYIPDEWRVRTDDTWSEVNQLLNANAIETVDFVVMHGMFPHQMPRNLHHQLDMHEPDRYLSITKHYIFVGHIHVHSVYDRILAAGSFDRVSHGEEGAKGHIRVTVTSDGRREMSFIENKTATRYVTIDCTGLTADEVNKRVETSVAKLPNNSHVRLKANKGDAALSAIDHFETMFNNMHFTVKETGKLQDGQAPLLVDNRKLHKTINITRDNITSLLMERVVNKHPEISQDDVLQAMGEILNE